MELILIYLSEVLYEIGRYDETGFFNNLFNCYTVFNVQGSTL